VLIVGTDKTAVEADLIGGRLSCPICQVGLRPWGHGVDREVRLLAHSEQRCFRRSICRPCRATHVLIPEDTLVRRRHAGMPTGGDRILRPVDIDFALLFRDQRRSMVTLARMLTGSLEIAEDLVQEAFVKIQSELSPNEWCMSPR
jgi:hypothetical protein